ncbi:TonB-dependent receptor [Massilia sp. Dwa41.01b]|uniref:TonB-dependent receptor plug domain-containing protein n=1 Tax=unclassified Massilia TaxID=2609279 RepID=UPI0016030BED|nr:MULTISPECIES: TonB-dependent receptor [unclassified Massilia]QNA88177.1 TonB-dependent receptor [Massilia sp. Dwa41.01b]QNA99082.1 TonB-dependent receptor [Massilia sp. Se16.2.3]
MAQEQLQTTPQPQATTPAAAQKVERVEVTGTRIKRADAEGALPVTVIKREELEASGSTTVAEFMRTSTFSSAGNFRPQSGSSAQSFAGIDLRGLGSQRTLVLLDGRRLPKAPNVGDSADLNTVPMAAVERIEILTDGASAVYGSDAIGGVVNIITRKDFEGVAGVIGYTKPENEGGARKEASVLVGVNGEKGRLIMGASKTGRGMVYTKDRPWGQTRGVTSYGNNYDDGEKLTSIGNLRGDPNLGCTDPNFYLAANGACSYNFNAVAADEAQIDSQAFFARGESQISDNWKFYANASTTNTTSFGRYAPTPAAFTIAANTPNNPTDAPIDVYHRTAAAGNRDTNTDAWLSNVAAGFQGKLANNIDLDVGAAYTRSTYKELGRNYIVRPILEQYANSGLYDLYNPNANSPEVLGAIKATVGRDGLFKQTDVYAIGTFYDLFQLPGGGVSLLASVESREEVFADIYDSLSEAGVIEGSAGNSASGKRRVSGAALEMVFPITKTLEASAAGRFDKYSDYGNDFSPKISLRWQPMKNLTLRTSYGEGFRAPSLPQLNQKETFSAESVFDPATCLAFGGGTGGGLPDEDDCNIGKTVQVDTYTGANSALQSEQSKQFSIGAVWDVIPAVSVKVDYARIEIDNKLTLIGAQDLIDRSNGTDPRAIPAGLAVVRNAQGRITRIQQGYANEGTLKGEYLDVSVTGRWKNAMVGNFDHELRYSNTLSYDDDGSEMTGTLGLPRYRATLMNNWRRGPFGASYNINVTGKNADSATRAVPTYVTHDVQATYTMPWNTKLIAGVVNAGGKMPKLVSYDGRNFNFYLYDGYGRQAYVRLEHKF